MDARKWIVLLTALLYIHSALTQSEDVVQSTDDAADEAKGSIVETDEEVLAEKTDPDEDGGIVDEDTKIVPEETGGTQPEDNKDENNDEAPSGDDDEDTPDNGETENEEGNKPENEEENKPENEEESKPENEEESKPENEDQPKADEVTADTTDNTKADAENDEKPVVADENDEPKKSDDAQEEPTKDNDDQPKSEDDSDKLVIPLLGRKNVNNGCVVDSDENGVNVSCANSELISVAGDIDTKAVYLNLDDNLLEELSDETFEPTLESLKVLSVRNNQIKAIKKTIFQKIPNVEVMDFSNNPLVSLNANTFSAAEGNLVKEISFSGCSLNDISNGVFDDLFNLEILDIGKNSLNIDKASLKELLIKLTALKTLTLPENYQSDEDLLNEICKVHDTMTVICMDSCTNGENHLCQTAQKSQAVEANQTLVSDEQEVLNEKPANEEIGDLTPGPKESTSQTRSVNGSAIGIIIGIVIVIAAGIIIKKNWGTLKKKWNTRGRSYPVQNNQGKSGGPPLPRSPIPQEEVPLKAKNKDQSYTIEINPTKQDDTKKIEESNDNVEQRYDFEEDTDDVVVMENGNYGNKGHSSTGYEVEMVDMRDIEKKPRIMSDPRTAFFNGMNESVTITEIKDTTRTSSP